MFKRKKKPERIVPGYTRTPDNQEFFIPQINVIEDKKTLRNKFVSPIFGTAPKDEVTIPQDRQGWGDIDKKYDAFRSKRKLTKEEAKRRYGHQYYEFMRVDSSSMKKVHTQEGLTSEDLLKAKQPENIQTAEEIINEHTTAVSVDEFFKSAEETLQENQEEIIESEVLKDIITEDDEVISNETVEEEREDDDILFQETEEQPEIEDIAFADDFEYEEYKPPTVPKEVRHVEHHEQANDFAHYQLPPISLFKKAKEKAEEEPVW
ncbi:MAG: hypothetical protein JXB08_05400, partial [Bacilli bacterium]|nr:hypothetical protein [Bacilli bacterium]